MQPKYLYFILALLPFVPIFNVNAQGSADFCHSQQRHQWLMQSDAQYRSAFLQMEGRMKDEVMQMKSYGYRTGVSKIPVVVHIIHLGEAVGSGSNIPDAQVESAIDGLNDRFRNVIGNGVDLTLEFCLAKIDPNGNPTTGINRVDGSGVVQYIADGMESNPGNGADEMTIKNLSRWPNTEYYNIWVVHNIAGSVAGFAYYPTTGNYDGTVLEDDYMTYGSLVLTHEVGHAFNLRHTFQGDMVDAVCPSNADCTAEGDLICDTPPHKQNDCGATNPCTVSGIWDNSRYNYMSYCFPSTGNALFTDDQKIRAVAATAVFPRSELVNNNNVCACGSSLECDDNNPCTVDNCLGGICTNVLDSNCIINSFPACENFESFQLCGNNCGDLCSLTNGWENLSSDEFDWTVNTNGTSSGDTGPGEDHTTGLGRYIYIEASNSCYPSKEAIATSPAYDLNSLAVPSLEFWYHMHGNDMGTLQLSIESPYNSGNWTTIFSVSGDQGDLWHSQVIGLATFSGNIVRFRFEGITGSNYRSDIALDDICVSGTACAVPVVNYEQATICNGESLFAGGNNQTQSGVYYDTLTAADGCDSINVTTLTVLSAVVVNTDTAICNGDTIVLGGFGQVAAGTYADTNLASNGCDSIVVTTLLTNACPDDILINMRAYLGGSYNSSNGLMNDILRTQGYLPLTEPYTSLFAHYLPGGGETMNASVLVASGSNAIVDWVFVELRDKTDNTVIIATRAALIQRDGDIVDMDGISPLSFNNVTFDDYYVTLRHRNHLSVMTASPVSLSGTPTFIDFSDAGTPTYGADAQMLADGVLALWPGNVFTDEIIKYSGQENDRDPILIKIGGTVPTNVKTGYFPEDVNMDGVVRYSGWDNDRDIVLEKIGGLVPTAVVMEQLP